MTYSQGPGSWNPPEDSSSPDETVAQYYPPGVHPDLPNAQYSYGQQPSEPKSNTLGIVIGIAAVCLVAALGVLGGMLLAGQKPSDELPVAVGESSQSSSTSTTPESSTVTETVTVSSETASPRRSSTATRSSETTRTTESARTREYEMFSGSNFNNYQASADESGWKQSTARCSNGYYARHLAVLEDGKVVICENHSGDRYYVGDFPQISESSDAYEVTSYRTGRAVAENGDIQYVLTRNRLTVYDQGKEIGAHEVVAYGVLNAG